LSDLYDLTDEYAEHLHRRRVCVSRGAYDKEVDYQKFRVQWFQERAKPLQQQIEAAEAPAPQNAERKAELMNLIHALRLSGRAVDSDDRYCSLADELQGIIFKETRARNRAWELKKELAPLLQGLRHAEDALADLEAKPQ
jgi:chromosome segregation ATPase